MAAEIDFSARCEPAQTVMSIFLLHHESGFGKIIFHCNMHHSIFGRPLVHDADCRLVSFKDFVCKCICYVLFHSLSSFLYPFCCRLNPLFIDNIIAPSYYEYNSGIVCISICVPDSIIIFSKEMPCPLIPSTTIPFPGNRTYPGSPGPTIFPWPGIWRKKS